MTPFLSAPGKGMVGRMSQIQRAGRLRRSRKSLMFRNIPEGDDLQRYALLQCILPRVASLVLARRRPLFDAAGAVSG